MADRAQQVLDDGIPAWEVLLGAPAARPIHSMVQGPDGRWYLSDELNHRLIIVRPDGARLLVGGPGYDAGEFLHPRGLAIAADPDSGETRLFVCDAGNHRIQVLTRDGLPAGAFGGFGAGPGQFNAPSDIALALPSFSGWDEEGDAGDPLLVVADQGNSRLQVFDADGVFVAAIGAEAPAAGRPLSRAGWPYFRLGADPYLPGPSRVVWREGGLDVTCGNGDLVRLDLAVALLPDFATWRREAGRLEMKDVLAIGLPLRMAGVPDGAPGPATAARTVTRGVPPSVERHLCRI
ncbi:MAG TPA: NHL repeat-containing protein [Vicinamibacterales bacterium]|nr:NHL repeat-containing protein [Vicinamibacterales bacterium]